MSTLDVATLTLTNTLTFRTVVLNDTTEPREAKSTVDPPEPNLTQRFLYIVCPYKGHPSRPQTLFKSTENQ